MILVGHKIRKSVDYFFSRQPLRLVKGVASAYLAYPIAEKRENRHISSKLKELRKYYKLPFSERIIIARNTLADTMLFAKSEVPYYRDLFKKINFDPEMVRKDIQYIEDLPYLDKTIIREQGDRLYSRSLDKNRSHLRKTGGSTGQSAMIYYDQAGIDYSAAVALYARERVGKKKYKVELHLACRFPDQVDLSWPTREDFKCFAMNRSNIFFDRIDDVGLQEIWEIIDRRRPFLVHEHPSTIYALACYIERCYGTKKSFEVFESSGELLQPYMREKIAKVFQCRVIDRYGLAELGIMAYELDGHEHGLQVLESEGWPESRSLADGGHELVFTGFRNRLMPLIRYVTGDRAKVLQTDNGLLLTDVVGRIHDVVPLGGALYPTHHIMDMLDHRIGGIQEFQIDLRSGGKPVLRIVKEPEADAIAIQIKIESYWPNAFLIEFVGHEDFVRVGVRSKFRHVVTA